MDSRIPKISAMRPVSVHTQLQSDQYHAMHGSTGWDRDNDWPSPSNNVIGEVSADEASSE